MYIEQKTITVTLSTVGAGNATSTDLNGSLQSLSVQASKPMNSSSLLQLVSAETTANILFKVKDPSTVVAFYYPRAAGQTSTGGTLGSSQGELMTLANERIKAVVSSSSGTASGTVTIKVKVS